MMAGLLFTIAAFLPTLLLIIVYNTQKKKNNFRTHSFKMVMYINFSIVLFEFFNAYLMYKGFEVFALYLLRLQWALGAASFYYSGFYNYIKFTNKEETTFKELWKNSNTVKYMTIGAFIIFAILLVLPITNHVSGVQNYIHKPHSFISAGYAFFVIIVSLIVMIKNKQVNKDNVQLLALEGLVAGAYGITQMFLYDVACSPLFNSAIILVIYICAENPDIFISKELESQEKVSTKIREDHNYLMTSVKKELLYKLNRLNILLKDYKEKGLSKEEKLERLVKVRYEIKALNAEVCNITSLILNNEADDTEVEISLEKYLERFYSLTNGLINSENINYRLDVLESAPAKVLVNTDDLFFTMMCMFKNAMNSTELGEIIFTIGGELVEGRHYLTLKCNDTGRGFTKAELEELQNTLANHIMTEKYDKNLIVLSKRREIYNGKYSIDSFEGAGSIVNVSLEYGFVDESKIPRKIIENLPEKPDFITDYKGQRLLIVGVNSFRGKELFDLYNIKVDKTEDPKEGMDWIKQGKEYEWIILNLSNPGAVDAARALKSLSKQYGFHVPYVAAVIPYKTKKYRQIINNNSIIDDYIIEPLEIIDLNTILEKVRRK